MFLECTLIKMDDPMNGKHQWKYSTPEEIRRIVEESLLEFARYDMVLLHADASEMSLAHRVAVYIERRLPEWHVDCEYNRNLKAPKTRGPDRKKILPDLIVHRRMTTINLLGMEFKKTSHRLSNRQEAVKRARELAGDWSDDMPRYCHAAVLTFPVRAKELANPHTRTVRCEWFHRRGCGTIGIGKPQPVIFEVSVSL